MESLKGTIVETIFRNNENGYTVALLETSDEVITLTGIFSTDVSGENIEVFGERVKALTETVIGLRRPPALTLQLPEPT
ncbi:MAG: hypothetical protein BWX99_02822 [Deltaproteobacteria bacterium ADurb.Bin151]|nr:MAG: hypothetical protein BWX99_02822 [Deltaproteobacteria bacterium ADurb.Bin151]